jgi:hypothetical protein
LTRDERLKAFDTPLSLFESIGECEIARVAMERGISPLVVQSIVRAMWAGGKMGGKEDAEVETSRAGCLAHGSLEELGGSSEVSQEVIQEQLGESGGVSVSDVDSKMDEECSLVMESNCKADLLLPPISFAATTSVPDPGGVRQVSTIIDNDLYVDLKREHDHAKAVKSDDAEVPVHWWDVDVCRGKPTKAQESALTVLREFCLRVYRRRLSREIRAYMSSEFGEMRHSWGECLGEASPGEGIAIAQARGVWSEAHRLWRVDNGKGWLERAWQGESRAWRGETSRFLSMVMKKCS